MSEGVRVEGLARLTRDLVRGGVGVDDLKDAFAKIARLGADTAARHAPRDTGRLQKSIRGNRARSKAVVTAGRKSVPYAGAINYGWPRRGIQASRFMQKADQEVAPKVVPMLEDDITRILRENNLL